VYRANAYRIFPGLRIRTSLFRRARLREVTMFSVYMLIIDWANKLNYSVDAIVIGAFLNTSAVAVWTVGQRLAEFTQRLTNQLNEVLFPTVVDNDASARTGRLQAIFVQGTRLSLGTVMPLGGALMLMAGPLVHAWVGPEFAASATVLRLLTVTVIVRVTNATSSTLLKGAGEHRLVAFTNIAAALCNLGLSIAIVKPLALNGVALGTLVPVCFASIVVIFPAGARRVNLSLRAAFLEAIWPALWPAAVMALFVVATKGLVADSLIAVAAEIAAAGAVYLATFIFFGLSTRERSFYLSKLGELTAQWHLRAAPSEGA
jgi:O-antigen/teichoic acid export membrane protein